MTGAHRAADDGTVPPVPVLREPTALQHLLLLRSAVPVDASTPRTRRARELPGRTRVAPLLVRHPGQGHWAFDYADRLLARRPAGEVLVQSSMSPSGAFHVGNLRDTVTAHLVARAVALRGGSARIVLSFDDYDAVHLRKAGTGPLAGFVGRPMADARDHARRVCRDYIAELKALGICPNEADADGHAPDDAPWLVRYQAQLYRRGAYLPWQRLLVARRAGLARALLASPDRLFRPYCRSCGRNTTVVHRLSARGVVYSCRACGARHRDRDLTRTKPAWAVDWMIRVLAEGIDCEPAGHDHCSAGSTMDRTRPVLPDLFGTRQPVIVPYGLVRQDGHAGKISGSRGGGLQAGDLLDVMPATMVLWLFGRRDCRHHLRVGLDLSTLNGWYAEYDAFCRRVRESDEQALLLWGLLSDGPPPSGERPFRWWTGRVQSAFFTAPIPDGESGARARHALAWLGGPGRGTAWLPRRVEDPPPGWHDPPSADIARADLRLSPDAYHAVAWALFGTATAPPLSAVLGHFGSGAVADGLSTFREDGSRPLRDVLVARLDGAQDTARRRRPVPWRDR